MTECVNSVPLSMNWTRRSVTILLLSISSKTRLASRRWCRTVTLAVSSPGTTPTRFWTRCPFWPFTPCTINLKRNRPTVSQFSVTTYLWCMNHSIWLTQSTVVNRKAKRMMITGICLVCSIIHFILLRVHNINAMHLYFFSAVTFITSHFPLFSNNWISESVACIYNNICTSPVM